MHSRSGHSVKNLLITDPTPTVRVLSERDIDLDGFRGEEQGDEGNKRLSDIRAFKGFQPWKEGLVVGTVEMS